MFYGIPLADVSVKDRFFPALFVLLMVLDEQGW